MHWKYLLSLCGIIFILFWRTLILGLFIKCSFIFNIFEKIWSRNACLSKGHLMGDLFFLFYIYNWPGINICLLCDVEIKFHLFHVDISLLRTIYSKERWCAFIMQKGPLFSRTSRVCIGVGHFLNFKFWFLDLFFFVPVLYCFLYFIVRFDRWLSVIL